MRSRHLFSLMVLAFISLPLATAHERLTEHTVTLGGSAEAAVATIADVAWLEGHWSGEGLGGFCEEIWAAPRGAQMVGMFRHVRDGKPVFFEIITLIEEEGGIMMSLKHFDPDLTSWEEKDETEDFRLLAFTDTELLFDGMTYKRTGDCGLQVYVATRSDGEPQEAKFSFECAAASKGDALDENRRAVLTEELRQTETAFAKTMADRDLDRFSDFLAEDTVFFTGESELRGKEAVVAAWKGLYVEPDPPFSWGPEAVSVIDSGELGLSSGPIFDPEGKRVGTYNSVWRREPTGEWKIIFDRGCPPCR